MSDYSKSVIYKIYKEDITEFYIGSTYDEKKRRNHHKSNCNNENSKEYNLKVYQFIRENGGYDNWNFEVLEIYPCDNEEQLVEREDYYYDLLKPLLNSKRPLRTEEDMKEDKAKYYQDNREYILKYTAKFYEDNKEEIQKRHAKYYEDNKESIIIKQKQKHNCECGGNYTSINKSTHCKTKKHIAFIEKKMSK